MTRLRWIKPGVPSHQSAEVGDLPARAQSCSPAPDLTKILEFHGDLAASCNDLARSLAPLSPPGALKLSGCICRNAITGCRYPKVGMHCHDDSPSVVEVAARCRCVNPWATLLLPLAYYV